MGKNPKKATNFNEETNIANVHFPTHPVDPLSLAMNSCLPLSLSFAEWLLD